MLFFYKYKYMLYPVKKKKKTQRKTFMYVELFPLCIELLYQKSLYHVWLLH